MRTEILEELVTNMLITQGVTKNHKYYDFIKAYVMYEAEGFGENALHHLYRIVENAIDSVIGF